MFFSEDSFEASSILGNFRNHLKYNELVQSKSKFNPLQLICSCDRKS